MSLEAVLNHKNDSQENTEKEKVGTVETLARLSFIARRLPHFSGSRDSFHRYSERLQNSNLPKFNSIHNSWAGILEMLGIFK